MLRMISEIFIDLKESTKAKWKKYQTDKNCIDGNGHVFYRWAGFMLTCKKCQKRIDERKYCTCC